MEQQSIVFLKDGSEHSFGIDWKEIRPPCDVGDILQIKTDGYVYLIVADVESKNFFYRSEDGVHWKRVLLDSPGFEVWAGSVSVLSGTWIVRNRGAASINSRPESFYYSSDALNWRYGEPIGGEGMSLRDGGFWSGDLLYFNDQWFWQVTEGRPYDYVEKGFFSKTKKTNLYHTTALYCASDLDGLWARWDNLPEMPAGIGVKAFHSIAEGTALLACCEQDHSYQRDKEKSERPPFVLHLGGGDYWEDTDLGAVCTEYSVFSKINDCLVCSGFEGVLTSKDGLSWTLQAERLSIEAFFYLKGLNVLLGTSSNSEILVTPDGESFKRMTYEDGSWRHLAAGEAGIVGIYHRHGSDYDEDTLHFGRYVLRPRA